ncbi:MAG: universal stress protein [Burkholderiaceae bacterium]
MYQLILVPIDGSATSDRGLEEAIKLGKLTGAKLRLIHVVDELSFALSTGYGGAYMGDILGALRDAGGEILSKGQAQVQACGLEVDTVLNDSFSGRVCDLVLAQVASWGADLIVLGTHGRRGVGRLFMGSDAEDIVRSATIPVLLLRADLTAVKAGA